MVDGMAIDHASLPSQFCEACIKAQHAHTPFPKEAKHCLETAGECVMSDVWGKTNTKSSEGYFYYISFTDDAKRFSDIKFMVDKKDAVPWIKDPGVLYLAPPIPGGLWQSPGQFGGLQVDSRYNLFWW